VAAALYVIPGLACPHVALMNCLDDLHTIGIAAVVHQEGGESKLDS
jgi:hypothetical protein